MKSLNKYHIASIVVLALVLIVQLLPFVNTKDIQSEAEVTYPTPLTWAQLPKSTKIPGKDKSLEWPSEIKLKNFEAWGNADEAKALFGTLLSSSDKVAVIDSIIEKIEPDMDAGIFVDALNRAKKDLAENPDVLTSTVKIEKESIDEVTQEVSKVETFVPYMDVELNAAASSYFVVFDQYPLYGEKTLSIFTYVWNPAGGSSMNKVNCFILVQILFIAFALFAFLVKNYLAKAVVGIIFSLGQIYCFINTLILRGDGLPSYIYVSILMLLVAFVTMALAIYFIPQWKRDKAHNAELKKRM